MPVKVSEIADIVNKTIEAYLADDEMVSLMRKQPLTTKTIVWRDRLVKMLDSTTWALSRVGAHEDFDFFILEDADPKTDPIAGNFNWFPVVDFEVVDDNQLRFKSYELSYILSFNDGMWRLDLEKAPEPDIVVSQK